MTERLAKCCYDRPAALTFSLVFSLISASVQLSGCMCPVESETRETSDKSVPEVSVESSVPTAKYADALDEKACLGLITKYRDLSHNSPRYDNVGGEERGSQDRTELAVLEHCHINSGDEDIAIQRCLLQASTQEAMMGCVGDLE
jgi:hypothetical protein